jgi:hypothetical protein
MWGEESRAASREELRAGRWEECLEV